jgi:hypothetical protein
MPRRNRGTEDDRMERIKTPGSNGDMRAGDEGLDDPATSRTHRDDMTTTPGHGDKMGEGRTDDASDFSGQGGQKEGAEEEAEGTGYTGDSARRQNRRENPLS